MSDSNDSPFVWIGAIGAAALSWVTNHSIGWAIVHAVLGWLYLIYYLFGGGH